MVNARIYNGNGKESDPTIYTVASAIALVLKGPKASVFQSKCSCDIFVLIGVKSSSGCSRGEPSSSAVNCDSNILLPKYGMKPLI